MAAEKLKPIHPGEVLREEFLHPFEISEADLARNLGVENKIIVEIISEKQNITADLALRLARFFGTSAHFWLGLQADYDLDVARQDLGGRLDREIIPIAA